MTRAQLVSAAAGAALLAHQRYGVDRSMRVDVLRVLATVAGDVFFRPLRKVCGAYIPGDDHAPGVLINSNLPLSRQRYTAAHEFGHLFLNHSAVSVDETTGVSFEERRTWSDEENIAETFAAFFLMPQPLVEKSCRDLGVTHVNAEAAYLLSLKFGTSYQATVNHLQTLKKVTAVQASQLRKVRPIHIKGGLSDSVASRHDVWVLDEHWNGQKVFPALEDRIVVHLNETPTSGYTWAWNQDPEALRIVQDGFADEPGTEVGGSRVREFVLEVSSDKHPERIELERRQPWDANSQPSASFAVDLIYQQLRRTGPLVLPTLSPN